MQLQRAILEKRNWGKKIQNKKKGRSRKKENATTENKNKNSINF
jgi:hypothetical protein